MPKPQNRLARKLEARIAEGARDAAEIDELLSIASAPNRFNSRAELRSHLSEGAVLSVGVIAGGRLSIPCGDYVVWSEPAESTTLVPTEHAHVSGDLLSGSKPGHFELSTERLLGHWDKLERAIHEDGGFSGGGRPRGDDGSDHFDSAPEHQPDEPYTFGAKVGRTSLWQAMQRADMGVTELADAVGVDKSTISRYLRDVKDGPGDPHGRNPSVALAQKVASVLGVDVDEVLPPPEDLKVPDRHKTSGSGRGGAGKFGRSGNQDYRSGRSNGVAASAESATPESVARLMVECRVDPVQFIANTVIAEDRLLNEFLKAFKDFVAGKRAPNAGAGTPEYDAEFNKAISAIKKLAAAFAGVNGAGGYTVRDGSTKTTLEKWLQAAAANLSKIKHNMPTVMAKKQKEAGERAQSAGRDRAQGRIDQEVADAEAHYNARQGADAWPAGGAA